MHYISCFLNLLENNWNSYYYDLWKRKEKKEQKPKEQSLQKQQKERVWFLKEPRNRLNDHQTVRQKLVTQILQTNTMR